MDSIEARQASADRQVASLRRLTEKAAAQSRRASFDVRLLKRFIPGLAKGLSRTSLSLTALNDTVHDGLEELREKVNAEIALTGQLKELLMKAAANGAQPIVPPPYGEDL